MFEFQTCGAAAGLDSPVAVGRGARAGALPDPYRLLSGLSVRLEPAAAALAVEEPLADLESEVSELDPRLGLRPLLEQRRQKMSSALVLSLILHLALLGTFSIRMGLQDAALQPSLETPPIPVSFAQPFQPSRFEFPESRESKARVRSAIKSDKDRKAQSRTPAMAGAHKADPASAAAEAKDRAAASQSRPAPPPLDKSPARSLHPESPKADAQSFAARSPSGQAPAVEPPADGTSGVRQEPSFRTAADPSRTRFEEQFDQMNARRRRLGLPSGPDREGLAEGEATGGGHGGLTFDTESDRLGAYGRILVQRVRAAWFVPQMANFAKGVTEIQFFIARDGTILEAHVSRSSGWAALDMAALNAVRGAAPLPPLPADFPEPRVGVTFRFGYT